jgi:tetratricopeptide (TPR) repeat protein
MKQGFSVGKLGHMYLFKTEYAKAESCYQRLSSSAEKDTRSEGRTYLALIPLYQGKFKEALQVLDDGMVADRLEQAEGWQNAAKHLLKATIYEEKRNMEAALKEVERGTEIWRRAYPDDKLYWRDYYAELLAKNNDLEKARQVANALKEDIEESDETLQFSRHLLRKTVPRMPDPSMNNYWYAVGSIELTRGDTDASLGNFEKAARGIPDFWAHYPLARGYLTAGRLGEAVAEFEKVLSRYDWDRAQNTIWAVKAYYLLGLAYEKSGWDKKAIQKYEEFLEIWKDADPGIPEVEDAKERLKKLRVQS